MTDGQFLVVWSCGMLALMAYAAYLVGVFDSCNSHKSKEKKVKTEPKEVKAEETKPSVSRTDAIKLLMDDAFFDKLLEDAGPNSGSTEYYPVWVCSECNHWLAVRRHDAEAVDCCCKCGCTDAPKKTSYRYDYVDILPGSEHDFYSFYGRHSSLLGEARSRVDFSHFVLGLVRQAFSRKYKNEHEHHVPYGCGRNYLTMYGTTIVFREEKGASE